MFSRRTNWELTQNNISMILNDLKHSGQVVIDLTESNPTHCGLGFPTENVHAGLKSEHNLVYAPMTKGLLTAREAVVKYYEDKGICLSAEQIFLTSSTSEGYSFLFRLLADPGQEILFPAPSYPLFEFLVGLNDLEMNYYPLSYEGGWSIDFKRLTEAISSQTRGVVLVNPNNPTGSYIKRDELNRLNKICQNAKIPLISDEVFFDYPFDPAQAFPTLAGNEENLSFVLGGLSKTLGLPQMKLSWIVVNGPEHHVIEAIQRLDMIADTYLSVNTPVQNALAHWMTLRLKVQKDIMDRVIQNGKILAKQLLENPQITALKSEGGWYAILKLPSGIDEEIWTETLLFKRQVYVHPGYFFNFEVEPYVIVSLLPNPVEFEEGIRRIIAHTKEAAWK